MATTEGQLCVDKQADEQLFTYNSIPPLLDEELRAYRTAEFAVELSAVPTGCCTDGQAVKTELVVKHQIGHQELLCMHLQHTQHDPKCESMWLKCDSVTWCNGQVRAKAAWVKSDGTACRYDIGWKIEHVLDFAGM